MERYLAAQTVVFGRAILLGLALGLLYDVLACACRVGHAGRLARGLWDLAYCGLALAAFLLFVLTVAGGELRSYVLLGCALGLAAWSAALSRPARAVLTPAFRGVARGLELVRTGLLRALSQPRGN